MELLMVIINMILILAVVVITIAIMKDANTREKLVKDQDITLQLLINEAKNTYSEMIYKTDKEINITSIIEKIQQTPTYHMLETNNVQLYITTTQIKDEHRILFEFVCSDDLMITTREKLEHYTNELMQPLYDEKITIIDTIYADTIISNVEGEIM